jgi:hypothetical protein
MRIPTVQLLTDWLKAHLQNLQRWSDPRTGRIHDPFESHQHDASILAESYSPATALVIAAASVRQGHPEAGAFLQGYCRRIGELLSDKQTPPFTALFLQYFGLISLADLKAVAGLENPPIAAETVQTLAAVLNAYRDRLDVPVNTNCAAMQAGVEILRFLHRGAADWARCKRRLDIVARQQSKSGFINDDLAGPSMPVAYHMFCLYLLAAALSRVAGVQLSLESLEPVHCADAIVGRGYAWLGHLLANDGMIAQFGRSRYHPFAQAAGAALLAAAGIESEDATVRRFVGWMEHYRLPADASTGLSAPVFAVTPNLCPPLLRVGFESYAMVTVYNNLAIAILLDALAWWTGHLPPIAAAADARKAFYNAARDRGCFADAQVGFICLRSRAGYVLVNLQTDSRGTTPAGSLMHLRLGDDLHEKAAAPPFWADPRVSSEAPERSVWEGPLMCPVAQDSGNAMHPPAFLMQGRTLGCESTQASVALRGAGPGAEWAKTILLEPTALTITWQLKTSVAGQSLFAVVPCLLWDGRWQTELRFDGPEVLAIREGRTWRLIARDREGKPLQGAWYLVPHRSTLCTTGVTGQLKFPVASAVTDGEAVDWVLRMKAEG